MKINLNVVGRNIPFFDPDRSKITERALAQTAGQNVLLNRTHTAVKFSLSAEAKENYRKEIQNKTGDSYLEPEQLLGLLSDAKVTETGGDYRFERLVYLNAGLNGVNSPSALLDRYTRLYDEIVQGYRSGERERFELTADGYRKVTMEEELENLDRAFEKNLTRLEEQEVRNATLRPAIIAYAHKLEKAGNSHLNFVRNAKKLECEPVLPENFGEKVRMAAKDFVSQYTQRYAQKGYVDVKKLLDSVKGNHLDFLSKEKA